MYEQVLMFLCHVIIMIGAVAVLFGTVWAAFSIVGEAIYRVKTVKTVWRWYFKYSRSLSEFERILDEHMDTKAEEA